MWNDDTIRDVCGIWVEESDHQRREQPAKTL
jgi:hypothetical protein